MKLILTLLILFISKEFFAKIVTDSTTTITTNKTWQFHGNIQLNNNGISPVPAFSLGKPALMSMLFITKGNLIYSPEFNYGADGLPWVVNNWLRYKWTKGKMKFGFGGALSLFFGRVKTTTNGKERITAPINQYIPLESSIGYNFSEKTNFGITYWRTRGLDYGSVSSGNFVMLSGNISKLNISKSMAFDIHPNLFYLKNTIPYEGFFGSMIVGLSIKKFPFHPFTQLVQPFWMGAGKSDFNWNYGVNYTF